MRLLLKSWRRDWKPDARQNEGRWDRNDEALFGNEQMTSRDALTAVQAAFVDGGDAAGGEAVAEP